jgi:hypothetical protein
MFARSFGSYSYHNILDKWMRPGMALGAGIGGLDYIVDYSKRPDSLVGNVMGAAFYTGAGTMAGMVLVAAHPLVFAGIAVGAPAYVVPGSAYFKHSRTDA